MVARAPAPLVRMHRIEVDAANAVELTAGPVDGCSIMITEAAHDAAVFLSPTKLNELIAALTTLRSPSPVHTASGRAIAEGIRQVFAALVELEKFAPAEADRLFTAIVAHVRSAKPYALTAVLP